MMSASKREVDAWMIISLSLSPSSLHVPSPTAFRPWWFVSSSSSFSAGRAGRRPPTNTRPLSPPLVLSVFRVRARVAAAVAAAFGCTWNWERRIVEPLRARCVSPLPPSAGRLLINDNPNRGGVSHSSPISRCPILLFFSIRSTNSPLRYNVERSRLDWIKSSFAAPLKCSMISKSLKTNVYNISDSSYYFQ